MQENIQKISPFKQRILQFVETLGISKREFYLKTGISRGTLENSTGITEDTMVKLFAIYPNINPEWIVLGIGSMIRDNKSIIKDKSVITADPTILSLMNKISEQAQEIGKLKSELEQLTKEKKPLEGMYSMVAEP